MAKRSNNLYFVLVLLLGGFLSAMTETIMNNSLTTIVDELYVTETTAQWLSTGYIMVVGIMMSISVYFFKTFFLTSIISNSTCYFFARDNCGCHRP